MKSFISYMGMLFLLLSSAHTATSQTEHYGYAYLALYGGSQNGQLVIVNPDTLQVESQLLLPLPSNFRHTRDVSLRPDGRWLIYQVEQSDDININRLMLFNLHTLEVREIPLPASGRADSSLFAWSPDSTYFTLAFIPLDPFSQNGPYIYNIVLATLDEMSGIEDRISSLSQSHQNLLLTSVIMMGTNYIEIYDSENRQGELIERYTLPEEPFRWIRSCNHTWSPDNQHIAFGSSCLGMSLTIRIGPSEQAVQELRVLDRATGNLSTLTDYTTSLRLDFIHLVDKPSRAS